MRRQPWQRPLLSGIFLSLLLITSACGKKDTEVLEDENPLGAPPPPIVEETPFTTVEPGPAPTSAPQYREPTPLFDFNRFNRTLGQCQGALGGNKGGLMSFLLRLFQGGSGYSGESYDTSGISALFGLGGYQGYFQNLGQQSYADYPQDPALYRQNGFQPTHEAGQCMGKLRQRMGRIRQWTGAAENGYGGNGGGGGGRGRFKSRVQNWLGHSTDWVTSGVQYPQSWPSSQMPQGPLSSYYQYGQTFFPQLQQYSGGLRPDDGGGNGGNSYYQPTN